MIIREKLRVLHTTIKSKIVYEIVKGQKSRHDIILSCFGAPSKSGPSYARLYAQENEIISTNVVPLNKIVESLNNDAIKALIFIDDIIGSGDTFADAVKTLSADYGDILYKNGIKVFICGICALEKGIQRIEKELKKLKFEVIVKAVDILNEGDQCFSEMSDIFESNIEKEEAKRIALDYGKRLDKKLPLGHDNCELLVIFKDNCPDNTISIIWDTSSTSPKWIPLFKRLE